MLTIRSKEEKEVKMEDKISTKVEKKRAGQKIKKSKKIKLVYNTGSSETKSTLIMSS